MPRPRAIATLTLSFGLVSIPVRLYAATDSTAAIRFRLLTNGGARVRQQFVAAEPASSAATAVSMAMDAAALEPQPASRPPAAAIRPVVAPPDHDADDDDDHAGVDESDAGAPETVDRSDLVKGYEFEKGRYVTFTAAELKALQAGARQTIDIVSFIPDGAVDPVCYDRAYYLAPDARGSRPYALLLQALQTSRRSALAKWAWRGKETVVQIRAAAAGLVLQQLLYAAEVRPLAALGIETAAVTAAELDLALRFIGQNSDDAYDPSRYVDEERLRILAAIDEKIAGLAPVEPAAPTDASAPSAQVIDLMAALRASLKGPPARKPAQRKPTEPHEPPDLRQAGTQAAKSRR